MSPKTYRDLRAGQVIVTPGLPGRMVVVYVAKRLREGSGHKITVVAVKEEDVIAGVNNPEEFHIQIGATIPSDPGLRLNVSDIKVVGFLGLKRETNVKYLLLPPRKVRAIGR